MPDMAQRSESVPSIQADFLPAFPLPALFPGLRVMFEPSSVNAFSRFSANPREPGIRQNTPALRKEQTFGP
jgi:hypothetical protein